MTAEMSPESCKICMDTVHACILRHVQECRCKQIICGFSGGADSTLLAALLVQARLPAGLRVLLVHVNHGLSPHSHEWQENCRKIAREMGLAFRSIAIDIQKSDGNMETRARQGRYDSFCSVLENDGIVLTAHHLHDQAETVLMRMFYGSGLTGLTAIPEIRPLGKGYLVRPMLDMSPHQIKACLAQLGSHQWINDESNRDTHLRRNYIRHDLSPHIAKVWPQWAKRTANAAKCLGRSDKIISSAVARHTERCTTHQDIAPADARCFTLIQQACASMDDNMQYEVIRHWLHLQNLPTPSEQQLQHILNHFIHITTRNGVEFQYQNCSIRYYKGHLYANALAQQPPRSHPKTSIQWQKSTDLTLVCGRKLLWEQLLEQAPDLQNQPSVQVLFRTTNTKYTKRPHCGQKLKKTFQQCAIPPWLRPHVPLIYAQKSLRLVWLCKAFPFS